MASQSQDDLGNGADLCGGGGGGPGGGPNFARASYPDYKQDTDLFAKFLREHTILIRQNDGSNNNNSDDDDDSFMEEPTAATHLSLRRIPAFRDHLQRIKDRRFYSSNERIFLVEIPLSELVAWDAIRGADLAQRASRNTLRYQELFCSVLDETLANLAESSNTTNTTTPTDEEGNVVNSIDVLNQHRLAVQQAAIQEQEARRAAAAARQGDGVHNHYAGRGQVQDDDDGGGGGNNNNNNNNATNATEEIPAVLLRRYELRILPLGRRGTLPPFTQQHIPKQTTTADSSSSSSWPPPPEALSLRAIRSSCLGRLVTVRGMIVRTSKVQPCTVVATYSCDACGGEIYQLVSTREFMPPRACPTPMCQNAGNKSEGSLHWQSRGTKFVKFQEVKLQELPSQVPMGHVPRSLSVYCRGELTRLAAPGDVVTMDGIFLPQRLAESGFRALKAGLISTTYLEAQHMVVHKQSYDSVEENQGDSEESLLLDAAIDEIAHGEDPIGRLSASIAPEIFGHEDIKRALLLMLVGGCTRSLPDDGMRIRGDINICLMGDPGVAKSQLLKHVASIAPRGVYTTGKGSSGVGLTAAVTKDMATGEMALEGGALVLADRGICCIDEFDKMDESDRTAIHEVMEQQTVSIAKAGIVATLNARAAVLAAANPLYGRYNRSKSLSENVNLPNSLLSRFDLMFLVLDIADVERDMALARHVTFVHQNEGLAKSKSHSDKDNDKNSMDTTTGDGGNDKENGHEDNTKVKTVTPRILREYIARARKHRPFMPPEVAPYVVEAYVALRMNDRPSSRGGRKKKESDQTVMTARQLLSILRLSQALARLRFSDYVAREDVDEAIRLTHMSKASLEDNDKNKNSNNAGGGRGVAAGEDVMSRIFHILRDYATAGGTARMELRLAEAMVLRKGFTAQQLQTCIEEYEALDVIQVNQTRTHVHFLDTE